MFAFYERQCQRWKACRLISRNLADSYITHEVPIEADDDLCSLCENCEGDPVLHLYGPDQNGDEVHKCTTCAECYCAYKEISGRFKDVSTYSRSAYIVMICCMSFYGPLCVDTRISYHTSYVRDQHEAKMWELSSLVDHRISKMTAMQWWCVSLLGLPKDMVGYLREFIIDVMLSDHNLYDVLSEVVL